MYNVRMKQLVFEWDKKKEKANIKKHGVSFEEDRFILLGTSYKLNTLVVCHCFREEETKVRIISARKADKDETSAYRNIRK